jgi:hypothetical protein
MRRVPAHFMRERIPIGAGFARTSLETSCGIAFMCIDCPWVNAHTALSLKAIQFSGLRSELHECPINRKRILSTLEILRMWRRGHALFTELASERRWRGTPTKRKPRPDANVAGAFRPRLLAPLWARESMLEYPNRHFSGSALPAACIRLHFGCAHGVSALTVARWVGPTFELVTNTRSGGTC